MLLPQLGLSSRMTFSARQALQDLLGLEAKLSLTPGEAWASVSIKGRKGRGGGQEKGKGEDWNKIVGEKNWKYITSTRLIIFNCDD